MIIKNAEFITSVADSKNFLKSEKPIIAVVGKSNVGKSSFINMLANKKKLAKTSNTPGRTRLINYFDFGEFILADLPGYGFAQVSKDEKKKWSNLLERYFENSEITHVFSLLDIRHKPTEEDKQMISYLYHYHLPFTIIATKSDKLGKSKIKPQVFALASEIRVGADDIIAVSSLNKSGNDKVLSKLDAIISFYKETAFDEEIMEDETEE